MSKTDYCTRCGQYGHTASSCTNWPTRRGITLGQILWAGTCLAAFAGLGALLAWRG